jgi:hypothetical protein
MGSKQVSQRLRSQLERSTALLNTWPRGGQTSCKKTASLCAPAGIKAFEAAATLWLALSPSAFYSINSTDTGGVSIVAPAQDQQDCNTCTALAVVAAAQAAVATTWQLDVDNVLMSAQVGSRKSKAVYVWPATFTSFYQAPPKVHVKWCSCNVYDNIVHILYSATQARVRQQPADWFDPCGMTCTSDGGKLNKPCLLLSNNLWLSQAARLHCSYASKA